VALDLRRQALALRTEDERRARTELELVEPLAAVCDEADPAAGRLVERERRHPEDCAGGGTQRLRARRVGAAGRERDECAEGIGRAQQGADVAWVGNVPQ